MKKPPFIFVILISILCSFSLEAKPPTFVSLYKKSLKQSKKRKQIYLNIMNQFLIDLEAKEGNKNKKYSLNQLGWLFEPAYAQNTQACVNVGFIAQVSSCDRSTQWSFDVRQTQAYRELIDAGFQSQCQGGTQPCALVTGTTPSCELTCSNNSTNQCYSQGDREHVMRMLTECENSESVACGSRSIQCAPMGRYFVEQMNGFDQWCDNAATGVRNLCHGTRSRVQALFAGQLSDENRSEAEEPLNADNNNVLIVGDSHLSCTNYAQELSQCLRNQNMDPLLLARGSAAPLHWSQGRYQGLHNLCGYDEEGNRVGPSSPQNSWSLFNAIENHQAGTVVFNLGDNIMRSGEEAIRRQFDDMLRVARNANPTVKCVLVSPTLPTAPGGGSYNKTINHARTARSAIQSVAERYGCRMIDGIEILRDRASGSHLTGGDGVHLSRSDSRLLGQRVCAQLESLLQNGSTPEAGVNGSSSEL